MVSTPSAKVAVLKLGRGSRPGFSSSDEDVLDGRQAEGLADEFLRLQAAQRRRVAHQAPDVAAAGLDDAARHAIGFRVDGGGIERLLAVADAQEAGRLLEGLGAEARHLQQVLARRGRRHWLAVFDDRLGKPRAQARDMREQAGPRPC